MIYLGHFGAGEHKNLSNCAKANFGCATPEAINQIPTLNGAGQSQITLKEIFLNIGIDPSKLAVNDIITTNVIPTKSFLDGLAVDLACNLDGWEFEFVTVKQNGVTTSGDANFIDAALTAGSKFVTTYVTAAGVTTATVTASTTIPAAFGAAGTNIVHSPKHNADYFGSYGAVGIKVVAVPATANACRKDENFGECAVFTATWRNLQPCIRACVGAMCGEKGGDVVVLA